MALRRLASTSSSLAPGSNSSKRLAVLAGFSLLLANYTLQLELSVTILAQLGVVCHEEC